MLQGVYLVNSVLLPIYLLLSVLHVSWAFYTMLALDVVIIAVPTNWHASHAALHIVAALFTALVVVIPKTSRHSGAVVAHYFLILLLRVQVPDCRHCMLRMCEWSLALTHTLAHAVVKMHVIVASIDRVAP